MKKKRSSNLSILEQFFRLDMLIVIALLGGFYWLYRNDAHNEALRKTYAEAWSAKRAELSSLCSNVDRYFNDERNRSSLGSMGKLGVSPYEVSRDPAITSKLEQFTADATSLHDWFWDNPFPARTSESYESLNENFKNLNYKLAKLESYLKGGESERMENALPLIDRETLEKFGSEGKPKAR